MVWRCFRWFGDLGENRYVANVHFIRCPDGFQKLHCSLSSSDMKKRFLGACMSEASAFEQCCIT
jgi:hypothetical protein